MYAVLDFINFYLIPGLVLGSIYALGAVGITLVFGILRFANFAHGETMTVGAYVAWTAHIIVGLPLVVSVCIAILITIPFVLFVDRAFYKPLRNSPSILIAMASFGVMLMVQSLIQLIFGTAPQSMSPGVIERPMVFFDSLRISPRHITIITTTVSIVLLVHVVLTYTKLGKAMRAVSDSPELARLTGINTEFVIKTVWAMGGGLAVVAGILLGMDTQLESIMGFSLLLPMFASAILGGIGKPYGAIAGGFIIGIAEELATYPWIGDMALLEPGYKSGVAFVIMIGMLLWRPSGLFNGKVL